MNPDILFLKDFVDQNFDFEIMSSVWCVRNKWLNVAGIKKPIYNHDDLLNNVAGRIIHIVHDVGGDTDNCFQEIKKLLESRVIYK